MDLPPAVSVSSSSAAHFLSLSTGTAADHNSSSLTGTLGGQTGSRIQPTVRTSTSALGSAPPAPTVLSEKCAHKDVTRCSLHRGECCSCGDNRPHEQYYERYVDGGGVVLDAPRWAHYCSYCRDYWDRLNTRAPSYRDNSQPRLTAWDLFHLATPPNTATSIQTPTHPGSSRHPLPPSAHPAPIAPEDGFPPSYAVFRLMSPNFSNEYHPVVAQHIRSWGELETRIADEPRYSPEFETLRRQYYTARYKAKRMTELDRQSRGGSLTMQARDEYFQLLSTPGPFDMPMLSGTGSSSSSSSGSSTGNNSGTGSNGSNGSNNNNNNNSGGHGGGSSAAHPNLGHIGISFGRVASFGNFLHSASNSQASGTAGNNNNIHGQGNNNISHHHTSSDESRSTTGGVSLITNTIANPSAQVSPHRMNRRRGGTPSENMPNTRPNASADNTGRPAPVIDGERERDRDREAGRITAGTSPYAAGSTTSEGWPLLVGSTTAASSSPSSSSFHSIPLPRHPASPVEVSETSRYHSHSGAHVLSFFRSRHRARPISSVTPDIETDRVAADRRRQLRERNESEWESQRPLSASSSNHANTNRTSVDSTIVDAVMSDLPSSQNSDSSNRTNSSSSEPGRAVETEPPVHSSLRHRIYLPNPPTSEPWSTSLLPGESSRNQLNEPPAMGTPRRDVSSSFSTSTPQNTMSGSPIAGMAPFVSPANRRSLRPNLLDQTTSPPTQGSTESSTPRSGLTSPAHRLPPNFLPSIPHLPVPRFSPPRTLNRPRGGSISNSNANHNRQNSNGSDGFPARRRERTNPLAQALGTRADVEREDYESPIRTMFHQNYEEYQRAEETRRRYREMEAEQRELLRSPPTSVSNNEGNMNRLQQHRAQRNYELLQRSGLQRQVQQNQPDMSSGHRPHPGPSQGWYVNWPSHNQPSPHSNIHTRSPDHALPFGITTEDDPSSNSEGDYEDLIPLDNPMGDDDQLFATLVDGYLSRVPLESANRRRARFRGQFGLSTDDAGQLPGSSQAGNRASDNDVRERFPTRIDRVRRFRDRDAESQFRHSEAAIRNIASFVTSARESGIMDFPHRWSREGGSGPTPVGRGANNNSSQTTRSLDHPERPDNMKEEDLKIMVDCKVCYGQIADMVLLPCAHLVLCQWCADTVAPAAPNRPEGIVAPRSNCPVCRARVEKKIKVFRC
ncbi:hypothetical protein TWF730_003134 [Orbilia blumenaviensis]|uniref:RING-type domain-containing protein n=1 Tax=Orbilia blumenaviensis TaxID=1796055 RepID=A0AAV9U6Q0_9PEZI